MRIGLLSDTHGQLARTRRGAQLLRAQGVAHVFHCGDIGSQEVLLALAEVLGPAGIPVTAVSGNMDRYDPLVLEFPGLDGVRVAGRVYRGELGGRRVAVLHGDDHREFAALVASGAYDFVFYGHTHRAADETVGRTRVINPGALQRSAAPSVAVVDLESGTCEWLFAG